MIERNLYPALDFWTAQPTEERKKILKALHSDEAMADHDFAGLPPQVAAGILAGLPPPESISEPPLGGPPTGETMSSKKKRGE